MSTMKNQNKYLWIGGAILIIGLIVWGANASKDAQIAEAGTWQDTEVSCLPGGHANAAIHIHPTLEVYVDGEQQNIPANTGINQSCMAEIHTHDATGKLHIESVDPSATLTLEDFFAVWDKELQREGYALEATVNGEVVEDIGTYALEDGDAVVLRYISTEGAVESATTSVDVATTTNEAATNTPPTSL